MIGEWLRYYRQRAGLSQRELAREAGTTQCAICRWERGVVRPGAERVRRLAEALGLDEEATSILYLAAGMPVPEREGEQA